jgi:LPXTG-site transpeptidase (sortase) family protein
MLLIVQQSPTQAQDDVPGFPILFTETGHTLAYSFREFYENNGGRAIFGLPLTEVFMENYRPVQYFQRARLEWHGELARVQVGMLGQWAAAQDGQQGVSQWVTPSPNFAIYPDIGSGTEDTLPDVVFFPQSGHTLRGDFLSFWLNNGGLPLFGYPITEAFDKTTPDGQPYTIQYFERMRFEYYPGQPQPFRLGGLGIDYLAENPAPAWATARVNTAAGAWDGVRPTRIRIPSVNIESKIVEAGFKEGEWDVPRFSVAHYWILAGYPFSNGNIVLAGHSGYEDELFNDLEDVEIQDEIFLTVGERQRRYLVQEIHTILPTETWVMNPTPTETLTLITCTPINVYTHRLIVRAVPAAPIVPPAEVSIDTEPITSTLDFMPILVLPQPPLVQDEPTPGEPTPAGEPAQGEPAQGEPTPAGEPAQGEPAQGEPTPAGDPAQDEPAPAGEPAQGEPAQGEPTPAEPTQVPTPTPIQELLPLISE